MTFCETNESDRFASRRLTLGSVRIVVDAADEAGNKQYVLHLFHIYGNAR